MRLKALKVEIEHLQLLMDKAKVKLQKEFEAWWAEEATSLQVRRWEHQNSSCGGALYKLGFSGKSEVGVRAPNFREPVAHEASAPLSDSNTRRSASPCSRASESLTNEK